MHRQHVQIAFHQVAFIQLRYLALGEIDAVQRPALVVNLCLRGIYVFSDIGGLVVRPERTSAECYDSSADRMYRKHRPVIEFVYQAAVIPLDADSGGRQEFLLVAFRQCGFSQCVSAFRRPAETIFLNRGIFQASAPEIGITDGSAFLRLQAVLEELLGIIHHQKQTFIALPCGNLFRRIFFFLHLNTVFPRKIFQCLHIRHAFMFHHEADSRA